MLTLLTIGCSINSSSQKMGIYVSPFYYSDPLTINVGEYSPRLKTGNPKRLLKLSDEIRQKMDDVNIETLYVLAIRLYDAGEKDEATYWYYTAQFRANVYFAMYDGNRGDLNGHPLSSFKVLAGEWINGYAGGKPEQLVQTLQRVVCECSQMGYIKRTYPSLQFKPEEEQATSISEQAKNIEEYCQWIIENKDNILRQRKESGIEGVY